ncbi:hypothetical protein AXK11_03755 [Cephaloticoccus primus]|uniref:Peptidase S49 domain-containing protein n=2 Tax=Cephaloticoccus primus TaxID=1548207 RepID=A0A139SQ11_9BACT|nr:hypothetical protein AXK11_03755 [Cephaloticoccus primus]
MDSRPRVRLALPVWLAWRARGRMLRARMKHFLTSVLGAFVALLIFVGGSFALMLLFVLGLGLLGQQSSQAPEVPQGAYLVVDMATSFREQAGAPDLDASFFLGQGAPRTLALRRAVEAIRAAGQDPRIEGLVLLGASGSTGLAERRELRGALLDFKESGKPVQAYLSHAMTGEYYLASVADDIALDPFGAVVMPGLASQGLFFKNAFEKLGVGVQVTRVGKYKSAVEPFTSEGFSKENREQLQQLLGDVWASLLGEIAAGRGLEVAAIQAAVDTEGPLMAESALKYGLVDRLAYRDEIWEELKERTQVESPRSDFRQITLTKYARALRVEGREGRSGGDTGEDSGKILVVAREDDRPRPRGRIAVLYAEGAIVDGQGGRGEIGAERFVSELRELRKNDRVKAIVLRLDSPGGSASASEAILREMRLAAEVKPVVVSMGSVAASGGYWISSFADRIFAEPVTVTGSIGVFGLFFNVEQLAGRLGVGVDTVKTGRFADSGAIDRPMTAAELAQAQRMVDWTYERFIERVAAGRGLAPDRVQEIAQGRVWSGTQAQRLGLVDELGGLREAIHYAAESAGLGSYRVSEYPKAKNFNEMLGEFFEEFLESCFGEVRARRGGRVALSGTARVSLGALWKRATSELQSLETYNDPNRIYARLPFSVQLD